jgi:hypothetical protein
MASRPGEVIERDPNHVGLRWSELQGDHPCIAGLSPPLEWMGECWLLTGTLVGRTTSAV